jgi:hypothetical protein
MVGFYSKTELLGILQGFNPWWSGQTYSVPEFKRLAWLWAAEPAN